MKFNFGYEFDFISIKLFETLFNCIEITCFLIFLLFLKYSLITDGD